jgi:hypothetical protein
MAVLKAGKKMRNLIPIEWPHVWTTHKNTQRATVTVKEA